MAVNYVYRKPPGTISGDFMPIMNSRIDLELFGVDTSFRYQMIRNQLLDILDKQGVPYTLAEVGDIDTFIEIGLDSVPSIRVDREKLFSVPESGDLDAVVDSVFSYIKEYKMKSILVPVDFSEYAENAVRYAVALADKLGMRIELMHVYHPVVDPHNAVILDGEMGNTLRDQLNGLTKRFSESSTAAGKNLLIESRFEIGYPVQVINEIVKTENIEFVIMGTLGATNVVDKMLGSNSSAVAMKTTKPVILVPHDAAYSGIEHLVVGFDRTLIESDALSKLVDFNKAFDAHIDFVHVDEGDDDLFETIRDDLVKKIFEFGDPQFSFDIHEIGDDGSGKANSLQNYVDTNKPDLLVVVAEKRNFLERLFHSSVSRKICLNPHGAILVLHKS